MAGTSNYPGALDDFAEASPTNLGDDDSTGRNHSERHDDVEAAMEAVQGELGVDPAGPSASTVAARFTAIDSALTGKASASVTITAGNGLTGGGDLSADRTISASFSATNPVVNGAAAPGSANAVSRGDHVHPNDTTKADLASPTFTGVPAAPTASVGTNTTQVATTAFVNSEIANDAILLNTVTASAQLLVGAGSASVAALSSGSAGQVLTVSGSATYGLAWLDATGGGGATVVMSPDQPVDQENGTLWVDTDSDVPTFTASAYVLNSLLTAKGDLIAATGSATPARLAIGANDTVLTADSTASAGVAWKASPVASQTGNSGKVLTTNGTATSWATIPGVDLSAVEVNFLVIGGGGGGAFSNTRGNGGGGAGGYRCSVSGETSGGSFQSERPLYLTKGVAYTVKVGAGGAAGSADTTTPGTNGTDSGLASIVSRGGGGGGASSQPNNSGGSGGGAGYSPAAGGGAGFAGQGYPGGSGFSSASTAAAGGGGGGAGAAGANGATSSGGAGGAGLSSSITGSAVTRGGGGGGGNAAGGGGTAGSGGGGAGANTGGAGGANTGGGGGGSGSTSAGNGGSGVVIIKFPDSVSISVGGGLTSSNSTSGGFKIYTFTAGQDTITLS